MIRLAAYFAVWVFLAWFFRSRSIRQDADGDVRWSVAMERVSVPGMIAFGLTVTLAAVDLLMSLNPHWYSTIIGVYFFGGAVLSGLVVLTLLALWLQAAGRLQGAITAEHYHDLGKLTFAFVVFWGYIAFSQYMLIWYANMPEETQFYMPRQIGPWAGISLALLFCQLLIPMFGLLSRHAKRHPLVFTFWAVWLLGAHLLDLFWLIMPNVFIQQIPEAVGAARNAVARGTEATTGVGPIGLPGVRAVSGVHATGPGAINAGGRGHGAGDGRRPGGNVCGHYDLVPWACPVGARPRPAAGRIPQLREYVSQAMHEPLPPENSPQVEPDEVNAGLLGVVGTFLAVVVVLIVVLLQAWFYNWRASIAQERTLPSDSPQTPLGRALVEQRETIGSYHWINREAKVRAIPVGRAMELVAQEMAAVQESADKPAKKGAKP